MLSAKKKQKNQKKIVQQKLDHFSKLDEAIPPAGWIKAIRGSMGLSIRDLAARVGVEHGSIDQLERREPKKKVTLEALERAARAMDCKVVYAVVPQESGATLDDIIQSRALIAAAKILKDVAHTMRLEGQGTEEKHVKAEIRRIAQELIDAGDSRIWDVDEKRMKSNVKN